VSHDLEKCRLLLKRPIPAIKVRSWIHFPRFAVYSLQDFEAELKSLLPWKPINKTAGIEKRVVDFAENEIATSEGQGINASIEAKHAIENYSMKRAKKYFEDLGYIVKDVSSIHSYDLHCIKDDKELLVEVKGTQTDGKKILLTKNEVKIATKNKEEVSLYILHSIQVIETGEKCKAVNGTEYVVNPWDIETGTLTPMIYEYEIPKQN